WALEKPTQRGDHSERSRRSQEEPEVHPQRQDPLRRGTVEAQGQGHRAAQGRPRVQRPLHPRRRCRVRPAAAEDVPAARRQAGQAVTRFGAENAIAEGRGTRPAPSLHRNTGQNEMDRNEWLASLKEGDEVAWKGHIYTISRTTPTRVVIRLRYSISPDREVAFHKKNGREV